MSEKCKNRKILKIFLKKKEDFSIFLRILYYNAKKRA